MTKEVLEDRNNHLGPDHPDTLRALESLALTHSLQEKYDEATEEYQRVLSSREESLGVLNIETIRAVQYLANCPRHKSKYFEAGAMYGRALMNRAQRNDPPGICTSGCIEGLAIVYRHQGRLIEAIHLFEIVLGYLRKTFGVHHHRFLHTTLNLSIAYTYKDRGAAAEYLPNQAVEGFRNILGADHPDTKRAAEQLAETQLLRTHTYNHASFHHGRQRASLELTEVRAQPSVKEILIAQHNLTASECSSLQGLFLEKPKSVADKSFHLVHEAQKFRYAPTNDLKCPAISTNASDNQHNAGQDQTNAVQAVELQSGYGTTPIACPEKLNASQDLNPVPLLNDNLGKKRLYYAAVDDVDIHSSSYYREFRQIIKKRN